MTNVRFYIKVLQRLMKRLSSWWPVRWWFRSGYFAKGLLYGLIGLFAGQSALGGPVRILGAEGVFVQLARQPFGTLLIVALSVGLAGYAVWRLIQAVADPEHDRSLDGKAILQRLGYGISGMSYGSIAYGSLEFLLETWPQSDDTVEDVTVQVMAFPLGELLIEAGGVLVIAVGLTYIYGAVTGAYISEFKSSCDSRLKQLAVWLGQVGYIARGIAFTVIGGGLIKAGFFSSSASAGGLEKALEMLQSETYEASGLSLIAIGFLAYGLYTFFATFYRRFRQG
ncbi:DUF1206 domain-containing protein [Romeria aff. gracilis LEGE 07310]|uniref:DUF1206 domain-containing protein n=1 Tax=Vasconcelosia minhoensis LEGE 07310 TaxID=915328 RepID=A0A8J7AYL8_9CYAN|nr:DUF1206 domain-containing protein [Romeria gracilis]MBE9080238.1 DUF1206 domain-containing protein [Romeria aff. gracilis LEGE 07310]